MNISDDTRKSFGFLRKSLKMSRRAIEKNQKDDGSTDSDVAGLHMAIDDVLANISFWEMPNPPPLPATPTPTPVSTNDPSSLFAPLTVTNT